MDLLQHDRRDVPDLRQPSRALSPPARPAPHETHSTGGPARSVRSMSSPRAGSSPVPYAPAARRACDPLTAPAVRTAAPPCGARPRRCPPWTLAFPSSSSPSPTGASAQRSQPSTRHSQPAAQRFRPPTHQPAPRAPRPWPPAPRPAQPAPHARPAQTRTRAPHDLRRSSRQINTGRPARSHRNRPVHDGP
jgi:hypothetical protein